MQINNDVTNILTKLMSEVQTVSYSFNREYDDDTNLTIESTLNKLVADTYKNLKENPSVIPNQYNLDVTQSYNIGYNISYPKYPDTDSLDGWENNTMINITLLLIVDNEIVWSDNVYHS